MCRRAAGSGDGALPGVALDGWPPALVQSDRPHPANQFLPAPRPFLAAPAPGAPGVPSAVVGNGSNGSNAALRDADSPPRAWPEGWLKGEGSLWRHWNGLWADFRRQERQLELYPCRGGCPGGVYSPVAEEAPSGRGAPSRPWGPPPSVVW